MGDDVIGRVEELDIDELVVVMLYELHANVPEADRPMSMSDLSDEQADRARRAVNAVVVRALLSKPVSRMSLRALDRLSPDLES